MQFPEPVQTIDPHTAIKNNDEIIRLRDIIAHRFGKGRIITVTEVAMAIMERLSNGDEDGVTRRVVEMACNHALALCADEMIFSFIAPKNLDLEGREMVAA